MEMINMDDDIIDAFGQARFDILLDKMRKITGDIKGIACSETHSVKRKALITLAMIIDIAIIQADDIYNTK